VGKNPDLLVKYKFIKDHYNELKQRQYNERGTGIHRIRNKAQLELLEFIFRNGKRTDMNIRLRELENKFESGIEGCTEIGKALASIMRRARKHHKIDNKNPLYPEYIQLLKDFKEIRKRLSTRSI